MKIIKNKTEKFNKQNKEMEGEKAAEKAAQQKWEQTNKPIKTADKNSKQNWRIQQTKQRDGGGEGGWEDSLANVRWKNNRK